MSHDELAVILQIVIHIDSGKRKNSENGSLRDLPAPTRHNTLNGIQVRRERLSLLILRQPKIEILIHHETECHVMDNIFACALKHIGRSHPG